MRHIGFLPAERAGLARLAATLTVLIALLASIGWAFQLAALTSFIPGSRGMKVNTALSLVCSGTALLILTGGAARRLERFAQALSIAVAALGLATLAEYWFGWNLGIDELLIKDNYNEFSSFRGRMSPGTATALVTVAAALIAMPYRSVYRFAKWAGLPVLAAGSAAILAYAWNAVPLVTDRWLPPMALNTGACLALLGTGILLTPGSARREQSLKFVSLAAIEIKILAGFIVAVSLLLVGGAYTYRANARYAKSAEWVARTQEVRAALASQYGSLAGAEVALRDSLVDPSYRAEYQFLVDDVAVQLRDLERLTADNPVQNRNFAALAPRVAARLAAMQSALRANEDFGLAAARAVIGMGRMTNSMQDLRKLTDVMDSLEARLLESRRDEAAGERSATLISLLITLAVASAVFLALFRAIQREMLAKRATDAALAASEQYNRSIVDSSPDCLSLHDLDGRLQQMTPQGCRLMEVEDVAALADRDWMSLWQGSSDQAAAAFEAARGGIDGRFQGLCATPKGTLKWWDIIVMPVLGPDGRPERLLSVARDISEVKRSEHDLLEANRFLDSLIENLPVIVTVKDAANLSVLRVNRAFERMLGNPRAEVLGKSVSDMYTPAEAELSNRTDREALSRGQLVDVPEQRILTERHGQRIFRTMKIPLGGHGGAARYLLAISVDITETKAAETAIRDLNSALEAKAEQLTATNRELESFSYSVSHDLRAPLRAIDGFALMLEEDYNERLDAEGRRYLSVIRESAKRMGALIDDLLTFSRLGRQPVEAEEFNMDSLIREVVAETLFGHDGAAPRIIYGSLPPVRGDRGLLRQVWVNLLANAVKYSSKHSAPCIEVSGRRDACENQYSVKDNGVGFDMEYAGKLFGVFQRLHRADEFSGTGVGLAIVQRIVTRHGGRVWAEGKVNAGATFFFALPNGVDDG